MSPDHVDKQLESKAYIVVHSLFEWIQCGGVGLISQDVNLIGHKAFKIGRDQIALKRIWSRSIWEENSFPLKWALSEGDNHCSAVKDYEQKRIQNEAGGGSLVYLIWNQIFKTIFLPFFSKVYIALLWKGTVV